ncbi:MAG: hypothetical protein MUF80_02940, partial [Burkholderiales bacterium]|nr:hypothetical protein [Burkholderiales bacterium]
MLLYVVTSTLIFWFGPIPWPVANVSDVVTFQLAALLALSVGYLSAGRAATSDCNFNLRPALPI